MDKSNVDHATNKWFNAEWLWRGAGFGYFTGLHIALQDYDGTDGVDEGLVLTLLLAESPVNHRLKGHLGGEPLVDSLYGDGGKSLSQQGYEGLYVLCRL